MTLSLEDPSKSDRLAELAGEATEATQHESSPSVNFEAVAVEPPSHLHTHPDRVPEQRPSEVFRVVVSTAGHPAPTWIMLSEH